VVNAVVGEVKAPDRIQRLSKGPVSVPADLGSRNDGNVGGCFLEGLLVQRGRLHDGKIVDESLLGAGARRARPGGVILRGHRQAAAKKACRLNAKRPGTNSHYWFIGPAVQVFNALAEICRGIRPA